MICILERDYIATAMEGKATCGFTDVVTKGVFMVCVFLMATAARGRHFSDYIRHTMYLLIMYASKRGLCTSLLRCLVALIPTLYTYMYIQLTYQTILK